MKGRGKRELHTTPAEFAEAEAHKTAVLKSLEKLPAWRREEELARMNRIRYGRMPSGRGKPRRPKN